MAEENEVAKELSGLRKEVYDARNLIIKTDNLLKTFHTELKNVSTRQEQYEKRHFIGHVGAYAAIAVVAIVLAFLWARSAGSSAREEADRLLAQAQEAQQRAEEMERQAEEAAAAREAAASESIEVYRLLVSENPEEREQGLARAAELSDDALSPFARDVIRTTERDLREAAANDAFAQGIAAYRRGDIREAVDLLAQFQQHASRLPEDWEMENRKLAAYYLGAGANQLGRHEQAIEALRWFVQTPGQRSTRAYAYLLLGDSLKATGQTDAARQAFEAGLEIDPGGQHTAALRRNLREL